LGRCRRQCLDDATICYDTAAALVDDRAEFAAHSIEISNFSFHLGQVLARNRVHPGAGSVSLIGETQKLAHLLDRKSKIARSPDKAQPSEVFGTVRTIVPACPGRRSQEINPLVVSDRLYLRVSPFGEGANREDFFCHWG